MNKEINLIYAIPVFFALICGLALLFWWRSRLTQHYRERLKTREKEILQSTLQEKDAEIEQLKYHNNELAKIIHKDNKLIPAMEFAVREYLLSGEYQIEQTHRTRGRELLEELDHMSQERSGILKNYEIKSKKLPSTNVSSVDNLLSYMFQKASKHEIIFDLSVTGSVKYLIETIIQEQDIKTLLADFIENAIIATKKCNKKNIVVGIEILDNCYSVDIFDSGESFTTETLFNLGLSQITTHAGEGGSGIGLMTAFELLRKYQASFVLEELSTDSLFTKKVSACFDGLGQYRIKTARARELKLLSKRCDIIFIDDNGIVLGNDETLQQSNIPAPVAIRSSI